jgi:hypothetical protein
MLLLGAGSGRAAEKDELRFREARAARAQRGGPLELSIFGGLTAGPVGALGAAAAYLPFSRLALGVAVGQKGFDDKYGIGTDRLRTGIFVRGYVIDLRAVRIGLGVWTSKGDEMGDNGGTATDGTPVHVSWHREEARRFDASATVDLFHGNVGLRLEAGIGRVSGAAACSARFPDGMSTRCIGEPRFDYPEVLDQPPPSWHPYAQLALVVRPGGGGDATVSRPAATSKNATAEDATANDHTAEGDTAEDDAAENEADGDEQRPSSPEIRVSLAGTHMRNTSFSDDYYSDHPTFDAGIAAEYLRPLAHGWRWGVGARSVFGTGKDELGFRREFELVTWVPGLFGWGWRSRATDEELELLGGVGPAVLLTTAGADNDSLITATGIGLELLASYLRPLTPRMALVVGLGVSILGITIRSGTTNSYLDGTFGLHGQVPVHVGLRFRL